MQILPRCKSRELIPEQAHLRTLVYASRGLTEAELEKYREEKRAGGGEEVEAGLEALGTASLEDTLQEGVQATVAMLLAAGVSVVVLSGDGPESVLAAARNAGIVRNEHRVVRGPPRELEDAVYVLTGDQLPTAPLAQLLRRPLPLVIARVSPLQKAQVVRLFHTALPHATSLAIGDGANDVSMLLAASIGVGLQGREGSAAARASDYALAQFRFLIPLLFFHGRESYRRNTYLVGFMFYKNVLLCAPLLFFGLFSLFSGQMLFNEMLYSQYNLYATAIPILIFALFDYQHPRDQFREDATLYRIGRDNLLFSRWLFVYNILVGCAHALVITLVVLYALNTQQKALSLH